MMIQLTMELKVPHGSVSLPVLVEWTMMSLGVCSVPCVRCGREEEEGEGWREVVE